MKKAKSKDKCNFALDTESIRKCKLLMAIQIGKNWAEKVNSDCKIDRYCPFWKG